LDSGRLEVEFAKVFASVALLTGSLVSVCIFWKPIEKHFKVFPSNSGNINDSTIVLEGSVCVFPDCMCHVWREDVASAIQNIPYLFGCSDIGSRFYSKVWL